MAIFHLSAKVISRGKGQSAIAAAAYRSGERLVDEATGEIKSYKNEADRILFTQIMAPRNAPEWANDRNRLWNEAERSEKRKDAQLAREIEVSLPHELTEKQREWLVKDFAREAFVRRGYAVDIAIHTPYENSDSRNHHAHLMVTMRTLGRDGFAPTKDRSLNTTDQLGEWREQWERLTNRHLERHGHDARIDHRSLEAQGVEREPTTHLGSAAIEIDRRGAQSDRVDELKNIVSRNGTRLVIRSEIVLLDRELEALQLEQGREEAQKTSRMQSPVSRPERPAVWSDHDSLVAQQQSAMRLLKRNAVREAKGRAGQGGEIVRPVPMQQVSSTPRPQGVSSGDIVRRMPIEGPSHPSGDIVRRMPAGGPSHPSGDIVRKKPSGREGSDIVRIKPPGPVGPSPGRDDGPDEDGPSR